ncbi:E3 ubiquitin-protein ligase UBR2 [Gryllus bimaculatus]|nr:E3 ubiquitin-protein ligase UBR2 [Gryllus bimaculatus]
MSQPSQFANLWDSSPPKIPNIVQNEEENPLFPEIDPTDPLDPSDAALQGIVNHWLGLANTGDLKAAEFGRTWRIYVPDIYTPFRNQSSRIPARSRRVLIDPLECFISGGTTFWSRYSFAKLTQRLAPLGESGTCAHIFAEQEIAFSCLECARDAACVLCARCFSESPHRLHSYRMRTSCGGGRCDCGDASAWGGREWFDGSASSVAAAQPGARRRPRTPGIFKPFCLVMLMPAKLPDASRVGVRLPLAHRRAPSYRHRLLAGLMNYCCREGRAVTSCLQEDECLQLSEELLRTIRDFPDAPSCSLQVVHGHHVAHQNFAMDLLKWLRALLVRVDELRALFAEVALRARVFEQSVVEHVLTRETLLWQGARIVWRGLFCDAIGLDANRQPFAEVFLRSYPVMLRNYVRAEHLPYSYSLISLSVQFFAMPSMARHLMEHKNAISRLELDVDYDV